MTPYLFATPQRRSLMQWLALALLACALLLSGCSAINAQNVGKTYAPVNATPGPNGEPLMLKGYDVVAYHTLGKHALGQSSISSVFDGVTYWFASADHKALFDREPLKYLPAYGGYCTNGIVYGIPWGGDGDAWIMREGKVYIFGGASSKAAFLLDPTANFALADKYWKEEIQGNNSFVQRTKRMVLRVPHYKSGAELAAAVEAAGAKAAK